MKLLKKYSMISALLVLVTLSAASQAEVVNTGAKVGAWAESGNITLEEGTYSMTLQGGGLGTLLFVLSNTTPNIDESFQLVLSDLPDFDSLTFNTLGGTFQWLTGGTGPIQVFTASVSGVEPVPLPSSVIMLGSALAALVSIGRRGMSRRLRA